MPKRIESTEDLPKTKEIIDPLSEFPLDDDPVRQLHELVQFFHGGVFGKEKPLEIKEDKKTSEGAPKEE